jgi:REP element-mobilizing transposase RayT
MARPLRIEYPGALYHVTSRGNAKQKIFRNDRDRKTFLDIMGDVMERFHFICHAYCLMDNHYHLVIETPEGNLSEGMRQINGVYTQRYNFLHHKTGHVFQGRYKAIIVDRDNYLLELVRYVALNPVRASMVKDPKDWVWSSYRPTAGIDDAPSFLSTDWVLAQFSTERKRAQKLYAVFVREGITRESPWKELKGQIFLGDRTFIDRLRSSLQDGVKEIPRSQRYAGRPELEAIITDESRTDRAQRDKGITEAVRYGYTLKEIAAHLGVHYATVSRALKRV